MEELEKLNQFTRKPLTKEEVYLFDVILCDNDIDRDLEAFSDTALAQMQKLFIGKTGIFDHDPRSSGQTARIYDTCLQRETSRKTRDGRPYVSLKAKAYMIRTDSNADLIREIDGGIKKEVSVSCSAGKRICSVCGADKHSCAHIPGRVYGDKTCHVILEDINDAYEWSFVAVPAQVRAGVTKFYKEGYTVNAQDEQLLQEIEKQMRAEVLQLCGREKSGCVSKALCTAAEKMDLEELLHFKQALLEEHSGTAQVQLAGNADAVSAFRM